MIELFTPVSGDKSFEYLGDIFGAMNGLFPGQGDIGILGVMFKTFNSAILAVAALMLVYMTIVGVVATAHEGEFMGKKWNNIWIPIRSVLGIALLVPTSSGFCGIQIIMMWVIIQGIGAADTLWTTALNYVNSAGSVYAKTSLPTSVGADSSFQGLFSGLVCDATAKIRKADPTGVDKGGYYCNSSSGAACSATPTINSTTNTVILGPDGSCGKLTYCNMTTDCAGGDPIKCSACTTQIAALQSVMDTFSGIAAQLAAADYAYRDFIANSGSPGTNASTYAWLTPYCKEKGLNQTQCCVNKLANPNCAGSEAFASPNANGSPSNPSGEAVALYWKYWPGLGPNLGADNNFIKTASSYYGSTLQTAYSKFIDEQNANPSLSDTLQSAQQAGWLFAGGYYYAVASFNGATMKSSVPEVKWDAGGTNSTMNGYRNNVGAAKCLLSTIAGKDCSTSDMDAAGSALGSASESATTSFTDTISNKDGSNEMAQLALYGAILLFIVQIAFVIIMAIILVLGFAGFLSPYIMGTGFDNPVGPAAQFLMIFILPAMYAAFGFAVTIGGLLSVYIPLMPYIIFTFGAVGWFISVIEAMVAGPLVALGIISPSGQHELMGKAEPAIMLLFNIFLRPSLMIFGLIAAMLLSTVVIKMINALFMSVVVAGVWGMGGDAGKAMNSNIFFFIMMLAAWVTLLVTALNKTFSIINVLPAQVIRWIGGHGEQAEAPMEAFKGAIEQAGAAGAGAAVAGGKGIEATKDAHRKAKKEIAEAKAAAAAKLNAKGG